MRKANTKDLFNMARLINDLGLKEDLFKAQQGKEDLERIGFDFFIDVLAKATTKEMENKIYDVLAKPFEMKTEEVGEMEIEKLINSFLECWNLSTLLTFMKQLNK
jgi:hypothetical protein